MTETTAKQDSGQPVLTRADMSALMDSISREENRLLTGYRAFWIVRNASVHAALEEIAARKENKNG